MKKYIALYSISFLIGGFFTPILYANTGPLIVPTSTLPAAQRVIESTFTGETLEAQTNLSNAFSRLVTAYEGRISRLQDEVSRLRIENAELRGKTMSTSTGGISSWMTPPLVSPLPKTTLEKKYDAIVSNVVGDLPNLLSKNNITATGSIGLFEFIEPNAFFISIDDGKNPAGVTAFRTKVLFRYDANFILTVGGVFDLDTASSRYATQRGSNPFSAAVRTRVKNPAYSGKLLEEVLTVTGGNLSSGVVPVNSSIGPTIPVSLSPGWATIEDIRKAYAGNKLSDTIRLANTFLEKTPGNTEVLTMRARSQFIFQRYTEALGDFNAIYKLQGDGISCGIVNDGARAETSLKGASGNVFNDLKNTKCKK